MPLAPLDSSVTWSLVDMQPSESRRSKLTRVAARSAASASAASSTTSVVSTTSMVARPGASIPAPFAMPPMLQPAPRCAARLGFESVVMMASEASSPPSAESAATPLSTPSSTLARNTSSPVPIRPVEHTTTSPAPTPNSSAARSAVWCVVWNPNDPVKQFAPPELSTTASTTPSFTTCSDHRIGLAFARLEVNTAAPTLSGPRFTTTATSRAPVDLSPTATPAASNPEGTVTLTGRLRSREGRWSRRGPARC